MTRRSINLIEFWLRLGFCSIPPLAFGLAAYVRFRSMIFVPISVSLRPYVTLTILFTLLWALIVEYMQLDNIDMLIRIRTGLRTSFLATLCCSTVVLAGLFFFRSVSFARIFVATGCVLTCLFSLAMIHIVRGVLYAVLKSPGGRFPIAILGVDGTAARVAQELARHPLVPCRVACHIAPPGNEQSLVKAPVVLWDSLNDVLERYECREILIALPFHRYGEVREIRENLQRLCIPTRIVLNFGENDVLSGELFDFCGLPLLDLRPYPVDTVKYAIGKRAFDIVFAIACMVVTAPLMAAIALGIKCTSAGPILFSQERVSLNGRRFRMLKFRTMVAQNDVSSSQQHTAVGDRRVTSIGKILRKTSLDELPQFVNVLKGEMSVVGPRPEITFFVEKFRDEIPSYMTRHNVKCGITGWAQVNGLRGSATSIAQRIQYDLYYMRHWSIVFDCKIIVLTLFKGFMSPQAY